MMLPIMFDEEKGMFLKYVCLNCGEIETKSCKNSTAFEKFKRLKTNTDKCCIKCKSENNLFKNGLGQIIYV